MKATYTKPTLAKREALSQITAEHSCNVSGYGGYCGPSPK